LSLIIFHFPAVFLSFLSFGKVVRIVLSVGYLCS
jgi:hypothetical protein